MNTDTTIAEVQERTNASLQNATAKNQYKIFDYFKDHTGLLVTCVSALVAIMSFVLRFAVSRMNYAYLEYWDIASLHANTDNQNELYMVVCSMLYTLSIALIHGLLSRTSDTFRYYNKLLSTMHQATKESKKLVRRLQRKIRVLSRDFKRLPYAAKRDPAAKEIQKKIEEYKEISEKGTNSIQALKEPRGKLRKRVAFRIAGTIILSYLIGTLFLALANTTGTLVESIRSSLIVAASIGSASLIYFLPAYLATRCSRKQYQSENVIEKIEELISSEIPDFPFEKIKRNGIKSMLSDKMLKAAGWLIIAVTVAMLFTMSVTGTVSAKQQRRFPIYTDGSTSYAIVYISDSAVFMEEATEKDGTLIIDTTKQRIVTSEDISYDMVVFDDVSVFKNDDTLEFDQSVFSVKDVVDAVESFFETLKTKIQVRQ